MKYALLVIEKPEKPAHDRNQEWLLLLHEIGTAAGNAKGIENLRESFWQIPLHSGLPFLGECIRLADKDKFRWQVLILDDEPSWIHSQPT
jgi:hypothetical protein